MNSNENRTDSHSDHGSGISRRQFLTKSALLSATAGTVAFGMKPLEVRAQSSELTRAGAAGFEPLHVDSPMAKWKKPLSLEFVSAASKRFSYRNWQSGNDDSVYYNLNIPAFFNSNTVMPPKEFSVLTRDIHSGLLDLTFKDHTGQTTPPLKDYLSGPKQVQAMMMAHKGKVVFEVYPGMNPTDIHVWMSASKTTASLLITILADEGKIDLNNAVPAYVPELNGTAWDNITVKNAMNMATGLDNEETFETLSNPDSWMSRFFTAIFEPDSGNWREMLKEVKPLASNEAPGTHFRYSTSITMVLVLAAEQVSGLPWQTLWNERVWSKIGARNPFIIGLTPDKTPVAGGLNNTTPEDFLRYALIYTPSWNVVASEQIVSDKQLKMIQGMGDPKAYKGSGEEAYGTRWFGETPAYNTAQWDHAFEDGAMFKHGNMGQGIYVDPARDFCGVYFGLASNDESVTGIDHSPGYLRTAAKLLAGG